MPRLSGLRIPRPRTIGRRLRAGSIATVLAFGGAAPLMAQEPAFAGKWTVDNATAASFNRLVLENARLTWRGPGPASLPCVARFAVLKEAPGTVYRDARGRKFVAGAPGSLPAYLLQVEPAACNGGVDRMRIMFPLVYDKRHMSLDSYRNGRLVSHTALVRTD